MREGSYGELGGERRCPDRPGADSGSAGQASALDVAPETTWRSRRSRRPDEEEGDVGEGGAAPSSVSKRQATWRSSADLPGTIAAFGAAGGHGLTATRSRWHSDDAGPSEREREKGNGGEPGVQGRCRS
jgi:hypothetical protein